MGAQMIGSTAIYQHVILPLVWTSAAIGVGSKAIWINSPRWVEACAFLTMGWACILGYGAIRASLTTGQWLWLLMGGLSFSVGTSAYVLQWPDFKWHKEFFRAHEAFHLGTIGKLRGGAARGRPQRRGLRVAGRGPWAVGRGRR